jgi:hypothetical protein
VYLLVCKFGQQFLCKKLVFVLETQGKFTKTGGKRWGLCLLAVVLGGVGSVGTITLYLKLCSVCLGRKILGNNVMGVVNDETLLVLMLLVSFGVVQFAHLLKSILNLIVGVLPHGFVVWPDGRAGGLPSTRDDGVFEGGLAALVCGLATSVWVCGC